MQIRFIPVFIFQIFSTLQRPSMSEMVAYNLVLDIEHQAHIMLYLQFRTSEPCTLYLLSVFCLLLVRVATM